MGIVGYVGVARRRLCALGSWSTRMHSLFQPLARTVDRLDLPGDGGELHHHGEGLWAPLEPLHAPTHAPAPHATPVSHLHRGPARPPPQLKRRREIAYASSTCARHAAGCPPCRGQQRKRRARVAPQRTRPVAMSAARFPAPLRHATTRRWLDEMRLCTFGRTVASPPAIRTTAVSSHRATPCMT